MSARWKNRALKLKIPRLASLPRAPHVRVGGMFPAMDDATASLAHRALLPARDPRSPPLSSTLTLLCLHLAFCPCGAPSPTGMTP